MRIRALPNLAVELSSRGVLFRAGGARRRDRAAARSSLPGR